MTDVNVLLSKIQSRFSAGIENAVIARDELTLEIHPAHLLDVCRVLRDEADFDFRLLVDVCGVDYLHYGLDDWQTDTATATGFGRGVLKDLQRDNPARPNRFAVVYHLLSLSNNQRLRLRVNIPDNRELLVDSVMEIWPSANWFEREAFDLFGILFRGHPDLRRLLTDYGFVGHPFRKDFPLIGKVEARYDAQLKRVVYEPVSIEARVLEPKVIRHDNRYLAEETPANVK
ncbi:NADH-quinone oxidoreductase chain 5 [Aquicella siphonis]|uniref:NADH-quinone oxidoreductase subunit C n=1 Tax=Aquicella siphonis TaxID=254247 RepID=A0A5E4PFR5_9COXI|nr:NADH-quinone oxidoreductase subunit C [Aquicella siphonis]VVC75211.1 NADH-quinone oxidoreductase chain 5 [Aquicella siphonis]